MFRIACVHQGYELYGSDRSFVDSVKALRAAFPTAEIEVVLPRRGPITDLLGDAADRITVEPLWVLRRQSLARLLTLGLLRLGPALLRAGRRLSRNDLVYINTCVIVDHIVAARLFRARTLLHIHEIPEGSARLLLRGLVRWSGIPVIFNSHATRRSFAPVGAATGRVIYNGVAGPPAPERATYDGRRPLRVLMLGRINRIKGQEVLLEALASLPPQVAARLSVRLVGSAFESAAREHDLARAIADAGLGGHVTLEPFLDDPAPLYRWADIVVVPSRRPESLGRVAIEAMSFGRPVLASAIGGLGEVVEDGRTGWLVEPADPVALAARLRAVVEDPAAWASFPAHARSRYERLFSEVTAADAIAAAARERLSRPGRLPRTGGRVAPGGAP